MNVYRVREENFFGYGIVSANSKEEAEKLLGDELSEDLWYYTQDGLKVSFKAELIEDLVDNKSYPRIISCFFDY